MDLSIQRTTVTALEDRSWLGSAHGTEATDTVTLDASLFTAGTHYPNGEIRSGTVLAKHTSGLYGPYAAGGANGLGTPVGYLFNTERVASGTARIGAPLLRHGKVRVANLPPNSGHVAAVTTALVNIIHL